MDITKWKPWNWFRGEETIGKKGVLDTHPLAQPIHQLHQEIDRLFDSIFRSFDSVSFIGGATSERSLRPSTDITENNKEYTITVEVPGVKEEDITLELVDRTLILSGEKKQEKKEKDENFHRVECSYGSFRRVLSLPDDAEEKGIQAAFKNGVLTITLPRKQLAKQDAKRIDIKKKS